MDLKTRTSAQFRPLSQTYRFLPLSLHNGHLETNEPTVSYSHCFNIFLRTFQFIHTF